MTPNPTSNGEYANAMVKEVHQLGKHFLNREIYKLGKLGKHGKRLQKKLGFVPFMECQQSLFWKHGIS